MLDNGSSCRSAEKLRTRDRMLFIVYLPNTVGQTNEPKCRVRLTKLYYKMSLLG